MKFEALLKQIRFDRRGLVPAIVQDEKTRKVLMVAFMNRQALVRTLATGRIHYWSRARKRLWMKGETSGHIQRLRQIYLDCDNDTILLKVRQKGGACHSGYFTCFYRKVNPHSGKARIVAKRIFDPQKIYK